MVPGVKEFASMKSLDETSDMKGKTCIVTGGNAGIGYMTALGLAQRGARVILVCRNASKGEAACAAIRKTSDNHDVHLIVCDMGAQADIRACADTFRTQFGQLDVLVNNHGAFYADYVPSPEGIEMQFAVNHLAYFLFTLLLLDLLKAAPSGRIVNVSSASHYQGKIDFDSFTQAPNGRYSGLRAYGQSKLGNVLFTYELARRLKGTNVTANCLHPGVVRTDIGKKHVNFFMKFMWTLMQPFMITPKQGAATSLHLATSQKVATVTGKFFAKSREKKSSDLSYDAALARRLWEASAKLTDMQDCLV